MNPRLWIAYLHTLYLLFTAGIDLLTAHQLMAQQQRFRSIHVHLWQVCQCIAEGQPYHQAILPFHPPPLIHVYLQVGEKTGQLEASIQRLHRWLCRQHQFNQQCLQALMYPGFIMFISLFFVLLMILWVLPQFIALYQQMNAEIPSYIHMLVNTVTPAWCMGFIITMCLLIFCFKTIWMTRGKCRLQMERILYRLPSLGPIFYRGALSQQCELLSMSCCCGIPLTESLALLGQHGSYASERLAWSQVHAHLLQGSSLSHAMRFIPYFESTLIELIDIGERTGKLDEVFEQSAIYYTETLSEAMGRFKEAIQPTIMLLLGLMLGGWVILLYYPIIQLGYLVG